MLLVSRNEMDILNRESGAEMTKVLQKRVAFISSFQPRKCGIATFTSDLIKNTSVASKGNFEPLVVAMKNSSDVNKYDVPVKFEIRKDVRKDYICAADYINFSHVDLVSVQHEFGLFGGEAGSYLTFLLKRLKVPVITTLHTVLDDPDADYRKSMIDLCDGSQYMITMNERGVDMLKNIYGVPESKIKLIAHGIPELPFVDNNYYKHKFKIEGRRTILTFGLLSKNKGIEVMLKAMPEIIANEPSAIYVILGMTHPSVLKHDGESYRFSLQRLVKELNLQEHVIFHNRFVSDDELNNFLCAADVYVTPYLNREQLTSGTLSFAVGTGKAVVSTPYWAAQELLANGRGRLVDFGNHKQMAKAVSDIFKDNSLFYSLRRKAYDYGRSRTWPKIGQQYWKLFRSSEVTSSLSYDKEKTPIVTNVELPEPSLAHIKNLTDQTGMLQHAKYVIVNRDHGYCTDDNARAVIAMIKYYNQFHESEAKTLLDIYLAFVMYAQNKDGTVRNFMNYDRTWVKMEPANDALGRVLWSLGAIMVKPPSSKYLSIVKDLFDKSVKHVNDQFPRGMAYSIIGMCDYLKQFPGASDIKRQLETAADYLVELFENNQKPNWQWFEDQLTYDNAVLPHALFVAGYAFANKKYLDIATKASDFLIETTFNKTHFKFIGCKGWYKIGHDKASFDQQPIEAASTVMMLNAAYNATNNSRYLTLQRKAFDWFIGENDLQTPVYDFKTKGCYDGLTAGGVNLNQGAESTISFMLALLTILESFLIADKINEIGITNLVALKSHPKAKIKEVAEKSDLTKKIENLL